MIWSKYFLPLKCKGHMKKKNVAFFTPQPLNDIYWLIIEEKNTWPKASTGSSHVYSLLIKNLLHNWKEKKSKLKKKRKKKHLIAQLKVFFPSIKDMMKTIHIWIRFYNLHVPVMYITSPCLYKNERWGKWISWICPKARMETENPGFSSHSKALSIIPQKLPKISTITEKKYLSKIWVK